MRESGMTRLLFATAILLGTGAPLAAAGQGPYWQSGGYDARIGSPYFYSVPVNRGAVVYFGHSVGNRQHADRGCACNSTARYGSAAHGHHDWYRAHGTAVRGNAYGSGFGHGDGTDPYSYHFGPGFYRRAEHGHFRFPYYSYRRPWYYPGQPVFNRDTNFAW